MAGGHVAAGAEQLRVPPGRQGPGPLPGALVDTLDLAVARRAGGMLPGDRRGVGVGSGTELAQLRPYVPGDDVRQLDPAASARTGIPHVREHVPERALTTWVLLDVSPSMAFGTADRLKSDVAEGVTLVVSRLALRRGGRIALATCGAATERLLPPRGGRGALAGVRRVLAEGVAIDGHLPAIEPGHPSPLARALARLRKLTAHPGLVVVVSDFRGPRDWRPALSALGARHGVLAVEVRDPREETLPSVGPLALVDPETGARVEVDTSSARLRERFAAAAREDRAAVAEQLRRARVEHVVLSTEGDYLRVLGRRLR
ncbi:MAG TPA: DUF58 domain-containing protein [Capillimicrobium sp.]|nr:DUF58 domain-containing protein [Capillimicrobium sp.]